MKDIVEILPHVNAGLNSLAAFLLVVGFVLIKLRREQAHKRVMLACFAVSVLFLTSYLVYHSQVLSKKFPAYPPDLVRYFYYAVLLTHVILAATVPFLALLTIYFGLREQRARHVRLARWTFPIWLYVSITGVVVYLMLYQIYLPRDEGRTIKKLPATTTMVLPDNGLTAGVTTSCDRFNGENRFGLSVIRVKT